jgi:hypothetical protein
VADHGAPSATLRPFDPSKAAMTLKVCVRLDDAHDGELMTDIVTVIINLFMQYSTAFIIQRIMRIPNTLLI